MTLDPRGGRRRSASSAVRSGAAVSGTNGGGGKTIADRVRRALEREIIAGELPPGAKLDEDTLAARHGASRTPVREALQHLASTGLIELRAHAGAFVATPSIVELAEMLETMAFLESACATLAARRHTADDRGLLVAAHEACAKAARDDDPAAFYATNSHFHHCVYAAAHNRFLCAQTTQLGSRLEAYRREATFHPGLMSLTMAEHEQILQAILNMDDAAAGTHMRGHLDTLRDDIVSMAGVMDRITKASG